MTTVKMIRCSRYKTLPSLRGRYPIIVASLIVPQLDLYGRSFMNNYIRDRTGAHLRNDDTQHLRATRMPNDRTSSSVSSTAGASKNGLS